MKSTHVLVAVVLAGAAVYFVSQRGGATEIAQVGDNLEITIGDHRLQATLAGREYHDSFVVVGGMRQGNVHFDTLLSVIPLEKAQQLAKRYGNFRRCGSAGAREAQDNILPMTLYAANGSVKRTLKKANKLGLAAKSAVIEMTFVPLKIRDHTIQHERGDVKVDLPLHFDSYLVREARIVEKDMAFGEED